jgi:hypothetical protein
LVSGRFADREDFDSGVESAGDESRVLAAGEVTRQL